MKIVKMQGGAGNQMFQWAFGKAIGGTVKFDGSYFKNKVHENPKVTQHPYALNFFRCEPEFVSESETEKYKKNNKLLKIFGIKTKLGIYKDTMIYDPQLLKIKNGFFDGYWQSPKYYESIRGQLLQDFTPRNEIDVQNKEMIAQMQSVNSVSLHVRRGDYVNLQEVHGLCGLDYYKRAIEYVAKKIENPHFFLFSDDVSWVKENLKIDYPYTVVDINNGAKNVCDLWLMKHCKHNIIANSSFSWWGAWLNENPKKIVIAPKQWFANGTKTDIIPTEWIRL